MSKSDHLKEYASTVRAYKANVQEQRHYLHLVFYLLLAISASDLLSKVTYNLVVG